MPTSSRYTGRVLLNSVLSFRVDRGIITFVEAGHSERDGGVTEVVFRETVQEL